METNCGSLNQHRLKGLDRKAVQGRRTVQHDGVPFGDLLKDIPYLWRLALNHLLGRAHSMHITKLLEAANDERLEKHQGHFFRQSTLVELQLGTNDDHRAT